MIQEIPKYYPECYIPQKLNDILHADSAPIKPIKPEILIKNPVKKKGLLGFVNSIFNNIFTKSYSKEFIAQKVKYENALNRYNKEEKKYQQQKQIFKHTQECFDFIINIHKSIYACDLSALQIFEDFIYPKWSKKQALQLGQENYRETYLPYKLTKQQDKENKTL